MKIKLTYPVGICTIALSLIAGAAMAGVARWNVSVESGPRAVVSVSSPSDHSIVAFQSDSDAKGLIGHWRKTSSGYSKTTDTHIILRQDKTIQLWTVSVDSYTEKTERGDPVMGTWSVAGRMLKARFEGEEETEVPFTFFEGKLVMPNIQGNREFWDRVE